MSNNTYINEYMNIRYHTRRLEAISLLGGKCKKCGSTENLEFDHIDKSKKTINISLLFSRGRKRFLDELKLCQLLCNICHKQKTSNENSVEHGGGLTGKKNCYCALCAPLKRSYVNNRRKKFGRF